MHILHWLNQKAKNLFVKLEGAVSGCFLFLFGIQSYEPSNYVWTHGCYGTGYIHLLSISTFKSYILVTFVVFVVLVCLVPTSTYARAWLHL